MLAERVGEVAAEWVREKGWDDAPPFVLERPADNAHGDYATNFCLKLARISKTAPRTLAEELRRRVLASATLAPYLDDVEVAGPGFVNLRLSSHAFVEAVQRLLAEGDDVGRGLRARPLHINLEFVSVNPNGPLHVGHGRYAAYGDSLHRLLEFSGHKVTSEFYINDYGRQMELFGRSVAARYAELFGLHIPMPEDGYQGEYVRDVARAIQADVGDRWLAALRAGGLDEPDGEVLAFFRREGYQRMLEQMKRELSDFRVEFDIWFSESCLHEEGKVQAIIADLLRQGVAYVQDDAVWLRTTDFGDDKDRVLIRSNERPTYFAADIAYHKGKLERGYDLLINVWGADHHGYVPRMKAAVGLLCGDPERLEVIIGQLVNLLEDGETRQMSTRRGELVTLQELVDAIGVDAARFFLVMRSHDQTLDLDIDLARKQSQENPVYYAQYAHARISSIIRNLPPEISAEVVDQPRVFATHYERDLIKTLDEFAWVVQDAAERREPHRIVTYVQGVAACFHTFYKHCRVIGSEPAVANSRLALCLVTKRVVARCLDLLGVAAPDSM